MTVYFVGAGPGDPELLTRRAERLIRGCSCCVFAGSLVSPEVLAWLPPNAERHDSATLSLEQIIAVCSAADARGVDVVRLHSGDPSIYGAIAEQMSALERLGIAYEVVPGISSFLAAAAALRVELTAPEVAQAVVLTRVGGRTPVPAEQELTRFAATGATLCIFLSAHAIAEIAATLSRFYGPSCPAAVVCRVSRSDQKLVRGSLADIASQAAAAGIDRTALIMVGRALERSGPPSKLYDDTFSHGYRMGARGGSRS